jgi:hypothetical protein
LVKGLVDGVVTEVDVSPPYNIKVVVKYLNGRLRVRVYGSGCWEGYVDPGGGGGCPPVAVRRGQQNAPGVEGYPTGPVSGARIVGYAFVAGPDVVGVLALEGEAFDGEGTTG